MKSIKPTVLTGSNSFMPALSISVKRHQLGWHNSLLTGCIVWLIAGVCCGTESDAQHTSKAVQPLPAAQAASAAVPTLSAEEILRRNANARGGVEAWQKIRTMVQIGRIERSAEVPGMSGQPTGASRLEPDGKQTVGFRLTLARPHKMRYDLTYQGVTAIQAFDGKEGFTVQPGPSGAVARPFSEGQTRAAAEQLDLEGPLLNATAKGTVVSLDAVEQVGERPAYKLSLRLKSGVVRHVWVDAETFMDVKIDGMRQVGDRSWPIETTFKDFRKVGSVQLPYRIETAVGGVHTMESVRLSKIALNVPLEDSLFRLPRATKSTSPIASEVVPP